MGVRGKVVVVTGASAGIGRDTAVRLARKGAIVVGVARDMLRLEQIAVDTPGFEAVHCDVAVDSDREALVHKVLAVHGRIDALVNNAGIGFAGRLEDITTDDVERLIAVNVTGLIDLTRRVLPSMLERHRGDVVNVASMAGYVALPTYAVYSATKFAVVGFSDALRREVLFRGVRVHLVNPGPIRTEWGPRAAGFQPPPGSPELRAGGIAATHVARAIERCLVRPWPRTAAVPRLLGLGRVADLPVVHGLVDVVTGAAVGR